MNSDDSSCKENGSVRNFLKENHLFRLLPNFEENEKYADSLFSEIKRNLIHLVKEKQFYDSFNYTLKLLRRYVNSYNLRFTKTEYLAIVELLYGVLIQKDIDIVVTLNVLTELKTLLKNSRCLSRDDLKISWVPLYDIWYYHNHSSKAKSGLICSPESINEPLIEVIRLFSRFFSPESTEEIWLLARPYLHCPYPLIPGKHNGLNILKLLLPFYYNNREKFLDIIWPHLSQMMSIPTWTSKCEQDLMIMLSRGTSTYVGLIDWTPYLDQLFTALLRSLNIEVSGYNKDTKFTNTLDYVDIIVYAIHGEDNCEPIKKLRQLFQAIDHLFHPSSYNHNTHKLLNLLYQISSAVMNRYRNERVKKPNNSSLGNYPKEFYLSDGHIKNIVNIMLPSCEFAIFTKGKNDFGAVLSSIQKLSCLCPEVMVPACLKLFHETSETVLEPHRALSTLAVVSMLHVPLLNSADRYPEGKLAVFPLMRQLITYININDPPKSYNSIICFGNLANILWMEDLSESAGDVGLTPFEKEVALATAQFEDLVLQFFDKLFEIIDIGFSESEMVESQRNSDFETEMLIDSLVMVIPNVSNAISQQVLDKTIDFAFGHSFLSEPIQQFFGAIFGCLLERVTIADSGFHNFMPRYMRYFRGLVQDDCILIHEKLNFKFVWLTSLLPGFIKTTSLSYMADNIMEVLLELKRIGTFESSKIMDLLLTYSINHCSHSCASLGIISEVRDPRYHLNSWSGIISRSDLYKDTRYQMPYVGPGPNEENFLKRIMSEIVSPSLERLSVLTDIVRHDKDDKIRNKELRSVCNILMTVCESGIEYLVPRDKVVESFKFDVSHGPLPILHMSPTPPSILASSILTANNSPRSILDDIKVAATEALSVIYSSIESHASVSRLQIPLSDVEDLFQLLHRSHDIRSGAVFYGQNKSFLDRRFESFTHPLRRMSNTMLNWVMTIDDWNTRRFKLPMEPLTTEISALADTLFLFLGLPHSTLQRNSTQCLFNLQAGYYQLDEYLIHKCLLKVTDKSLKMDEYWHAGISQLLLKIFEKKSYYESITFVYKFISIFVALGRSPHVDVPDNRNLHSKMFDLLDQYMGSFTISSPDIDFDFSTTIACLGDGGGTISRSLCQTSSYIVDGRKSLYYSCLDYCFSSYLDNSVPGDDAPSYARSNFTCSLSSTTTWQSIYQMSIILPFHIELPIPLRFVELFFLIIFSPSKELSIQGCSQINFVVWLLKQNITKLFETPAQLGLEDVPPTLSITAGARPENVFMVIEKDTDYWGLPSKARLSDMSNGYLWWPQRIKIRQYRDKEPHRVSTQDDSNQQCWTLLSRVFESEDFCNHLESFMMDLGSQFLREEEGCQTSSAILKALHQFSVRPFVKSMFVCIGPGKGLPLVKKVYERLVKCTDSNQVYANRMAVQLLAGIAMSTKHWTSDQCSSFFSTDLLTYIDLYIEGSCKSEVKLISKTLIELCVNSLVDCRQLLPVYRHFIHLLDDLEHDSNKESICLYFVRSFAKNCGWRVGGSIIEDMCDLWRKFVTSPVEKLRKEAGKIMKLVTIFPLLTNQYFFCTDEQRITFQKFPGELIQMFASQTQLLLSKKGLQSSVGTIKALKITSPLMTEFDLSEDESFDSSMQTMSETPTPMDSPPNEPEINSESGEQVAAPDKIVSSMISSLTTIFMDLGEFISHDLLKMFFICFDLIPIRDNLHSHLSDCAAMVAHIVLSDVNTPESKHARLTCSSLFSFLESATQHKSWRVRLIAVKMLQIISFNNFFVVSRADNISRLLKIAMHLMTDVQIEVRKESSVMLSVMIQCSMYRMSSSYVTDMCDRITTVRGKTRPSAGEVVRIHSGILGLCAFITAHPYDIPSELPEILTVLCRHINKPEPISGTVKDTLSRFKKSHQDSWHLQRVHFTEDQLCALTDVLVSPSYYA